MPVPPNPATQPTVSSKHWRHSGNGNVEKYVQYYFDMNRSIMQIVNVVLDWSYSELSSDLMVGESPLPSNRRHRSNGDCLEGKRENYQVCSVQYYVQQLCTVQCTHMNRPDSSLDLVLSHWAHFTVHRFIFVYVLFCVSIYIACMCSIVTWWGGPGGLKPILRTIASFSALTLSVGSFDP